MSLCPKIFGAGSLQYGFFGRNWIRSVHILGRAFMRGDPLTHIPAFFPGHWPRGARPAIRLAVLAAVCLCGPALAKDDDEDEAAPSAPAIPNLYLDLRTNYGRVPAGALSIGFG